LHPHVHCIVTGGALERDGSAFVQAPKNFLFPHRALARVFRAIFLRELEHPRARGGLIAGPPELADDADWKTLMRSLHRHDWVVHIEAPFAEPGPLIIRYSGATSGATSTASPSPTTASSPSTAARSSSAIATTAKKTPRPPARRSA
jgi:hypothetical protein